VTPDEIKALRKDLACTARELATALGIEQATVLAWEKAELFPTKAFVDKMNELRAKGPGAIPRKPHRANPDAGNPLKSLADPQLWMLVRKLAANKKLRDEVAKLAEPYPDPATE
jgi:transcriptional regulator with XRE-family HTH domain